MTTRNLFFKDSFFKQFLQNSFLQELFNSLYTQGHTGFDINLKDLNIHMLNDSILQTENLYIVYALENNNLPKVLFISSYKIDPENNNFLYIYNVCSDTKNTKNFKQETKKIFQNMKKDFLIYEPQVDILSLFIEQNNPSFSKAFSLYYNNEFMPVINTLDTDNQNLLSRLLMCQYQVGTNKDNCNFQTTKKMLMMNCLNPSKYNFYYPSYLFLLKSNKIKRGNKFIDPLIAFSHRCYCIMNEFFVENLTICTNILENYNNLFKINNGENKNIKRNTLATYYDDIESYINYAKTNNIQSVLRNPEMFRLISTFKKFGNSNLYFNDIFKNNKIRISNKRIEIKLHELTSKDFNLEINLTNLHTDNYYSKTKTNISKIDIEDFIKNHIKQYIQVNFQDIDLGMLPDNDFLYIPSGFYFTSDIDPKYNIGHSVSFIYDKKNERLFFYDSWKIYDKYTPLQRFSIKILRNCIEEIIIQNKHNIKEKKIQILDEYIDDNGNKYYCKIQQFFADDPDENMCVLLSFVPYICLMFIKDFDPKKTRKQLQFYMWFLFYSSIIFRQKKDDGNIREMEILNYNSNILIIFPYLFFGLYKVIEDMFNKKISQNSMLTNEDIETKDLIISLCENLYDNILKINERINDTVNDPLEITYKYF